jgi:uncharacterized protein HemX
MGGVGRSSGTILNLTIAIAILAGVGYTIFYLAYQQPHERQQAAAALAAAHQQARDDFNARMQQLDQERLAMDRRREAEVEAAQQRTDAAERRFDDALAQATRTVHAEQRQAQVRHPSSTAP